MRAIAALPDCGERGSARAGGGPTQKSGFTAVGKQATSTQRVRICCRLEYSVWLTLSLEIREAACGRFEQSLSHNCTVFSPACGR